MHIRKPLSATQLTADLCRCDRAAIREDNWCQRSRKSLITYPRDPIMDRESHPCNHTQESGHPGFICKLLNRKIEIDQERCVLFPDNQLLILLDLLCFCVSTRHLGDDLKID